MIIPFLFNIFFFLLPFVFLPFSSELFEFNKIVAVYIFAILIIGSWLWQSIATQKFIFRRSFLDVPLFLFLFSQILATIFSIDRPTSLFGYYSRFNGGLVSTFSYIVLYWAYVSNTTKRSAEKHIRVLLLAGTLVAIWGALEHFGLSPSCLLLTGQANASCWVQDVQHRVFATLGQPNWLAAYLILLLPLAWMRRNHIAGIIMFSTLLFTKSRSGLLGFLAAFAIFWLLSKKGKTFFAVLGYCILIALVILLPKPQATAGPTGPALEAGGTESGTLRQIVWRGAFDIWRHNPIVGTGVETFAYAYYQFRPAEHNKTSEWDFIYNKAHNEYLNAASTTGTVGLAAYAIFILSTLWLLYKTKSTGLLAGYAGLLVTNFFGFSVVMTSLLFFLYPAIAYSLTQKDRTLAKKKLTSTGYALMAGLMCGMILAVFSVIKYWLGDYYFAAGRKANETGKLSQAETALTQAMSLNPWAAVYSDALAYTYAQSALALDSKSKNQFDDIAKAAVAQSDRAYSLSPRNVTILKSRANMFLDLASKDKKYLNQTLESLKELEQLAPSDPTVFYRLGIVTANMGDINLAISYLKKALELKSNYEAPQKALQFLNKQLGQ